MRLDLHIHTTASDGAWPPERVVAAAAEGRLDVIAIADHDTVAGVAPARAAAREHSVQVVPAIELSSTLEGRELHILGYFVDDAAPALADHAVRAARLREERMREMVARLAHQGVEVSIGDVLAAAGDEASALARPHLAQVLVDGGHVPSVPEAFRRLIGDEHPAFVPTGLQTPATAIALIHEVGGLAVWAHPPGDLLDDVLPLLVDAGLDGLEVYRPSWKRNGTVKLEGLCRSMGLMASGGSDWHTPAAGSVLGDFHVTASEVEGLLSAGGM